MSQSKSLIIVAVIGAVVLIAFGVNEFMNKQNEDAAVIFSSSPVGEQMNSAMEACSEAQKNGQLPGFPAVEKMSDLKFTSNTNDFAKRNDISYPMEFSCTVEYKDIEATYSLRRSSADADWQIVPGTMAGMPSQDEVRELMKR